MFCVPLFALRQWSCTWQTGQAKQWRTQSCVYSTGQNLYAIKAVHWSQVSKNCAPGRGLKLVSRDRGVKSVACIKTVGKGLKISFANRCWSLCYTETQCLWARSHVIYAICYILYCIRHSFNRRYTSCYSLLYLLTRLLARSLSPTVWCGRERRTCTIMNCCHQLKLLSHARVYAAFRNVCDDQF
jgi:hypothetical protein